MLWLERLPDEVNSVILGYLNGQSLVNLGQCGRYWATAVKLPRVWRALDDKISSAARSSAALARDRVLRHEIAADHCQLVVADMHEHFEFAEPYYYEDYDKSEWHTGKLHWQGCDVDDCEALHLNIAAFWGPIEFSQFEVFLCLSNNDDGVLWQGFLPAAYEFDDFLDESRITLRSERASEEIMDAWHDLKITDPFREPAAYDVHTTDKVLVTVVAVDREDEPSFLVATQYRRLTEARRQPEHRKTAVTFYLSDLTHEFGCLHADDADRHQRRVTMLKCDSDVGLYQIVIVDM